MRSTAPLVLAAIVTLAGLLGAPAAPVSAAIDIPLLRPKPPPPLVIAPVAAPISADPAAGVPRGTLIMVHAGGWAGHDARAQRLLAERPGAMFLQRGWRVVSIDYEEGTDGLLDVLAAARAEVRRSGDGPICVYGESSGGHLALVAAAQLATIDCVIGLGAPTDLAHYEAEGSVSPDGLVRLVAGQARRFFGTTTESRAPWDPVTLAPAIAADVLLLHENDDMIVPTSHSVRFKTARPTTQTVGLEAGGAIFVHGTASEAGRAQYAAALGSFADRVVAARDAELSAERTGCERVDRSVAEVGLARLQGAIRCLARKDAAARRASPDSWRRTTYRTRGEINAARIWASLRNTASGRRALAATAERRAKISVRIGDPSRVTLRVTR